MDCAACAPRLSSRLEKLSGVKSILVNYAASRCKIEYDEAALDLDSLCRAMRRAGFGVPLETVVLECGGGSGEGAKDALCGVYGVKSAEYADDKLTAVLWPIGIDSGALLRALRGAGIYAEVKERRGGDEDIQLHERMKLLRALCAAVLFTMPLVWDLHPYIQLVFATIVQFGPGLYFYRGAWRALRVRSVSMDFLIAASTTIIYIYSIVVTFTVTVDIQLYFLSECVLLSLILFGKYLETLSKNEASGAIRQLMRLRPKTAIVILGEEERETDIDDIREHDLIRVRPGERIPIDGVVLDGTSAVNEAALTGESIPADKAPGDTVSAATVNQSGFLTCRATRVGQDTTLSQIIQMVSDAAATKAPIAKIADKVSGIFVPAVISIAIVTTLVWLLIGKPFGYSLARGISVLVISCPCAFGLATPVAIMVGSGLGAKNGILFKTAASLEETGRIQIVALDKTGTITSGEPAVTDLLPAAGISEDELLSYAVSLEQKSEHPLAKAILKCALERKLSPLDVTEFQALPGNGLKAVFEGKPLCGGNDTFIGAQAQIPAQIRQQARTCSDAGKTPLYFSLDGKLLGVIAVADVIKEDSPQAVRELQNMGIRVVMLTGDNERTAKAIGRQAGVDEVIAGVLPEGKELEIRKLKAQGKTAMVGDGINDAPALTRADIGVAIGAGTDVAIDAADVVLMKSRLLDVPAAIRLSRATLRNIHENLFWAFFYNTIGIPLAAGVFIPLGLTLSPMFGAAAMSLSSFCVVSNALRLNLFKLRDARHDHKRHSNQKPVARTKEEPKTMKKTMHITGMMCGHCEARVKKALEAVDGVDEALVSHEAGTAVVTLSKDVADETLKQAVEAQDYPVTGIE